MEMLRYLEPEYESACLVRPSTRYLLRSLHHPPYRMSYLAHDQRWSRNVPNIPGVAGFYPLWLAATDGPWNTATPGSPQELGSGPHCPSQSDNISVGSASVVD